MTDPMQAQPTTRAEDPAPIVSGPPVQIADGVFVIPDGRVSLVPNVGIIVGQRAALIIESGLGPISGRAVYRMAQELAGGLPLYLTLTHFHPEHGFGAQAISGATLIYNRAQHEEFRQKAQGYLDQFRGMGDKVATELAGVEFVDPQLVYDGGADLDLGGLRVQLRSWGAAHSKGDQVVFLPDQRVLFTGDLVEDGFYPVFPYVPPYDVDVDGHNWIRVIEELRHLDPAVVVPGHGDVGGPELLTTMHGYLTFLRDETGRLAAEGHNAEAITAALVPQLQAQYPDWDNAEVWRILMGVQTYLAQTPAPSNG